MARDVEFTITVRESPEFADAVEVEIDGPIWANKLSMKAEEWDAFQSLLQPSTKADFTIIEGE